MLSYLLVLFGVCGVAVASLLTLKYVKKGSLALRGASPIRVTGRQYLGPGTTLFLVEYRGANMLIGVSRSGIAMLDKSGPS